MSTSTTTMQSIGSFFWDAHEQMLKTFCQVFLATLTASQVGLAELGDASILEQAAVGGLGAVLSLVFSWISRWATDDTSSASALPSRVKG